MMATAAAIRYSNMFARLAARDLLLVTAGVALWLWLAPLAEGARFGDALGLLAGLGLVLTAYLAHEWGHALAALASGARIHPPETLPNSKSKRAAWLLARRVRRSAGWTPSPY